MAEVTAWKVWTDGSCMHGVKNAPKKMRGAGGWAAIVEHGSDGFAIGGMVELRGRSAGTTNVRMELVAAIEGLRATPRGCKVVLHTDCTTLLCVRDRHAAGVRPDGPDRRLWEDLAHEIDVRTVSMRLIVKGEIDPVHRRVHAISRAQARGQLTGMPAHAEPVTPDVEKRIRKERRRHERKPVTGHLPGCDAGVCMSACPVAWWRAA